MGHRNFIHWQYNLTMAWGQHSCICWISGYFPNEVVKMILKYVLFMLSLFNLVAIAILTYKKEKNWVMSLSVVEAILVYLALTINA